MFTGIVEETGTVTSVRATDAGIQLTVRCRVVGRGLKLGESVAVNGCCLTVVKHTARGRDKLVRFDLLQETWERTDRKSTRLNSSHGKLSRMPSSA